ncbi:glycosyltransferase [Chryseobacterium suipulveris]|uniref:Glycosyltransferase n=1 Tax=Chryseobacterium suipulveris TaxID=2929800 RepID=A0ABY4BYC9_9FLAO|nr:glycosyltransferase [Chryseobacterium suipulveris]UOE41530.1 glycosyltransferase [Chryseobacterium suipulveris]
MKNLLFITWDGPQTSYMEGLFMPIFQEVSKRENIRFHVMQFTWADPQKIAAIKKVAEEFGIQYTSVPIMKKPVASLGSLFTLFTSTKKIEKYIRRNNIDVVMPRSTFPAFMVNKIKNQNFSIIFDADGLPIEERVDFAGLSRRTRQYRWMKAIETRMLKNADAVITRSQKAIELHLQNIGESYRGKFSVVKNGKDATVFIPNEIQRIQTRKELGIADEKLFVYAGSLGPQYGIAEMLEIFGRYSALHPARFLILTGSPEVLESYLTTELRGKTIIRKVPANEVPRYLNAADLAFAIRKPTFSMQGVAPIKLGEYLLCGLPVIASKGIGDSESILKNFPESYLFDHDVCIENQGQKILNFIGQSQSFNRENCHVRAKEFFSLEAAAESYISALKKLI